MRLVIIVWLAFIVCFSAQGQNLTISAKVLDKETKEPLPFASVGIKGKPIGTITNLSGEFDFHFPEEYRSESFVISMLGYENYDVPASTLAGQKDIEILMLKSTTILNTVVISDSLQGGDILRIALRRIDQNYPDGPFLLDGFYRDLKKVGGTYVSLLEAAIKIYDDNYQQPRNKSKLRERVSLQEVRRSLGYSNKFTTYFDQDNLLEVLLLNNDVRYRLFPEEEFFFSNLHRETDSYYNGHEIFVVSHMNEFKLKLYIDKKSFGIIRVEYENNIPEDLGKKRGLIRRFESIKRIVDFKYFEGKFFLNYLTIDYKLNWYDPESNKLKFETELQQQLLINHVYAEPEEKIAITQRMRSYGLQYQDQPYNKKFWDNYNVIKESPLDKKIVTDLEREGPLERQFEKK
ncbi:MAG: carboxypeptidase-like regulatory domain-containing protein [Cyclobacteriaceae bacterium]|nr:carboxypeptidase-like regulatory domain-containing protein [Cyclobacteriaceae bacterium]